MLENDYFLNKVTNPTFTEDDFREVGLTIDNTSIESKDKYKNLDFIKNNELFKTDGLFDESKFNKFYDNAVLSYNLFSNDLTTEAIVKNDFFRNDIYSNFEERFKDGEIILSREANPLRVRKGLITSTSRLESPLSVREIAQTQKVWDEKTQSWQDAPNESFIDNFKHTRVLAQWDKKGTHIDPITGLLVEHEKNEKKINANGTYYYENLNGRDIYGREVLSKFDTLTTDGSTLNKFDFFDSDDKKKSFTGNLVKNAVKVGAAFIPGVNTYYIGARIGLNTVDLLAKLGKMFTGSESPTFSALEGFSASLKTSTSDYSRGSQEAGIQGHLFSLENILNIGGDTFTQLAEQRWIFKYVPALIKGSAGYDKKAADEMRKNLAQKYGSDVKNKIENIKNNSDKLSIAKLIQFLEELVKYNVDGPILNMLYVQKNMDKYNKEYQQIGKYLSQAYMTGITVADSYAEAKEAGASDLEATLLTLGYAIGEYKLINSDLGLWILPELKQLKQAYKQVANKLFHKQPNINSDSISKYKWVKKLVDFGKSLASNDYGKGLLQSSISGALSEGVEEVSEEILYDVSKSCFNLINYLRGDETKMEAFNDVGGRYLMSFIGGAIGGSLGSLQSDYRLARLLKSLNDEQALQQFIHIIKEGEDKDFLKTFDKMDWASTDLSSELEENDKGILTFKKGTKTNNLNEDVKKSMHNMVKMVKDILNAHGGTVSDTSLLSILTDADKDFRFLALLNSLFASMYLLELNTLDSDIVKTANEVYNLSSDATKSDSLKKEEENKIEASNKKELEKKLKELVKKKEELVSGKRNGEFIERALWEMNLDLVSACVDPDFTSYAESMEHKNIKDIAPDVLKNLENKWKSLALLERKDQLRIGFDVFKLANLIASEAIKTHVKDYYETTNGMDNAFELFRNFEANFIYDLLQNVNTENTEESTFSENLQESLNIGETFNINSNNNSIFLKVLLNKLREIDPSLAQTYIDVFESKLNDSEVSEQKSLDDLKYVMSLNSTLLKNPKVFNALLLDIKNINYLNQLEKISLKNVLNAYSDDQLYSEATLENLDLETAKNVFKLIKEIDKKAYSPVINMLSDFISKTSLNINLKSLINLLNNNLQITANNINEFTIDNNLNKTLLTSLSRIKILKKCVLAARTDAVSLVNRIGYNTTVNELFPDLKLAEIDVNTAQVIILDLSKLENSLTMFLKLFELNSGLLLLEHNKISVNLDLIIYNKLCKLIELNWPPEDWEGVEDFKLVLNSSDFKIIDTLLDESRINENRKLNLSKEERKNLKEDYIKIEKAVHAFFKANQSKLKDPELLSKLLNSNIFSFQLDNKTILNENTEEIHDADFVWWLATLAVLNPEDFYGSYKDSITNEIAPIATLELAIKTALAMVCNVSVFKNFAKAYNISLGEIVARMSKEEFAALGKRPFLKDSYLDSDVAINFIRTVLVEGIAGSGKSTGVLKPIINILRNVLGGKDLLDNVWFVNTSKKRAQELALSLGFSEDYIKDRCFSREEYLLKIAPNIKEKRIISSDTLKLNPDDLELRNGLYHYNIDFNKSLKAPKLVVIDEVSGFSQQDLLLIDDFSEYFGIVNLAAGDFDQSGLLGKVNLKNNTLNSQLFRGNFITPIKLGASLRSSNFMKDYNNKLVLVNLENLKSHVIMSPILLKYYEDDLSILGDKTFLLDQIEEFSEFLENTEKILKYIIESNKNSKKTLKLGYIFNDTESKIYKYLLDINESGEYKGLIDFKEGSTSLGLEADYYIIDLNPDKTLKQLGGTSETDYIKYWKDFYTGLTRSKKGSLIYLHTVEDIESYSETGITEFNLSEESIKNYGEDIKEIYNSLISGYKPLLYIPNKSNKNTIDPNVVELNGSKYYIDNKEDDIPLGLNTLFSFDNKKYIAYQYLLDDNGNSYIWLKLNLSDIVKPLNDFVTNILPHITVIPDLINPNVKNMNEPSTEFKTPTSEETSSSTGNSTVSSEENILLLENLNKINEDVITFDNKDPNKFKMLLYSFITNETGFIKDENGDLISGELFHQRVDSLNGLLKILIPKLSSVKGPINLSNLNIGDPLLLLKQIRSILLHENKKSTILANIAPLLGKDPDNLKIKFGLRSSARNMKNPKGFGKFVKQEEELLEDIYINDNITRLHPKLKTINAFIYEKNEDGTLANLILEMPLLCLTNPISLLESNIKGFEFLNDVYKDAIINLNKKSKFINSADESKRIKSMDLLLEVDSLLSKDSKYNTNPLAKNFLLLLEIYYITYNLVFFFDDFDNEDSIINNFEGTGPLMIAKEKGTNNFDKLELYYDGRWIPLHEYIKNSGKSVSSVFSPANDLIINDKVILQKGHPVVLVSDYINKYVTDTDLIEQYCKQLEDPNVPKLVKAIQVSPPISSIPEYFKNLNLVYVNGNDAEQLDSSLGNEFTNFDILQVIFENNAFENPFFNTENDQLSKYNSNYKRQYKYIKNKIEELTLVKKTMTNKEFLDFLLGNLGLIEFTNKIGFTAVNSWKSLFLIYLRKIVLSGVTGIDGKSIYFNFDNLYKDPNDFTESEKGLKFIRDKIFELENLLKTKANWKGVFYHLPLDYNLEQINYQSALGNISLSLNKYTILDGNFGSKGSVLINGKIDSLAFIADVLPLLKIIKSKIPTNPEEITKAIPDTIEYLHGKINLETTTGGNDFELKKIDFIEKAKKLIYKNIKINTNTDYYLDIKHFIELKLDSFIENFKNSEDFEDLSKINLLIDDIKNLLSNDTNYMVFDSNNITYIIKIDGFSLEDGYIIKGDTKYKFEGDVIFYNEKGEILNIDSEGNIINNFNPNDKNINSFELLLQPIEKNSLEFNLSDEYLNAKFKTFTYGEDYIEIFSNIYYDDYGDPEEDIKITLNGIKQIIETYSPDNPNIGREVFKILIKDYVENSISLNEITKRENIIKNTADPEKVNFVIELIKELKGINNITEEEDINKNCKLILK